MFLILKKKLKTTTFRRSTNVIIKSKNKCLLQSIKWYKVVNEMKLTHFAVTSFLSALILEREDYKLLRKRRRKKIKANKKATTDLLSLTGK